MEGSRGKGSTTPTGQKAEVAGNTPGDVRRMLLEAGGPSTKTKSGIDLTAAAHKLGVTRRTVERWLKTAQTGSRSPMSALRGKIFSALTGQKADVSGKPTGDLRGMLLAVGGASPKTKSGIDLTAAAHKLGVTRRTVERWLKAAETGEAPEAPENVEDLDLTPEGLADEPAKQEDPDSPAEPENS